MAVKQKVHQWAPTELPRMRRELFLAAEEAADRAVSDPKVAARYQADEEKFAAHVAKTDPAMAQQLRSRPPLLGLHTLADMERRHALHFRAAELYWVTRDMTRVALDASTDMPPWTPSAVIPVPIGLLIWAEDLPRIVWRGHDNSPMVPIDGILWEQSGGYVEFIVLTRTDRAITEGITTTWRAPFITVHSVLAKADDLITYDDDRYEAGLIAAIGSTWTLMQMPTVAAARQVTGAGGSGTEWRRDNRRVSIIDLRRQENQSGATETAVREYKHRWYVRGHWRQQPYGPAQTLRRPTWIPGHIKGPAGAPLLAVERVHVWRR